MAFIMQVNFGVDSELEDFSNDNCLMTIFRTLNCTKCRSNKYSCVSRKYKKNRYSSTTQPPKDSNQDDTSRKMPPSRPLTSPAKIEAPNDMYGIDNLNRQKISDFTPTSFSPEYNPIPHARQTAPSVSVEKSISCAHGKSVSELRKQFESRDDRNSAISRPPTINTGDYSIRHQDRQKDSMVLPVDRTRISHEKDRNEFLSQNQRSNQFSTDQFKDGEKYYESRQRYKSIIDDAPLYQMYNEASKRTESKIFRQRLRESIRLNKKEQKVTMDAFPKISGIADINHVIDESSSSDEVEIENHIPSPSKNLNGESTFVVNAVTEANRDRVPVTRTSTGGEMRSVASALAGTGPGRIRWSEMPEVISRNLSNGLTPSQRMLQEARFEILTSEASYYKSLTVLIDLFYKSPVFNPNSPNAILTAIDKHQLFSNILEIHATSENLLHALELNFRKDPMMQNICEILYEHSESKLSCYITYLKNQMYQVSTLTRLLGNPAFAEIVRNIQSVSACNCLDLNSFLVLPMQRAMRLRLLVEAVLHHTPTTSPAYRNGLVALASLEKLIYECNFQKGHMERKERLVTLSRQLEFNGATRAIGMSDRELVKEGKLRCLPNTNEAAVGFRRKFSDAIKNKPTLVTLFLFTDILLITRQKGDRYLVDEVSPIDKLTVSVQFTPADAVINRTKLQTKPITEDPFYVVPKINLPRDVALSRQHERPPTPVSRDSSLSRSFRRREPSNSRSSAVVSQDSTAKMFTFIITFPSERGGSVDYHLMADTLEARERWIDALNPGYYSPPPEVSYDTWDCPQMIVISGHGATEYDELDVREGDLMNVIVELSDGWLKGTLPDGRLGWVPKQICAQVENPQARRQNMKNFLLSEEAHRAYEMRKKIDQRQTFVRMQDIRSTKR